ncbi:hypothetical protein ACFPM0_07595 [Pseudonocardia sulfidoxydans]|uniref:hypothetical protein n=1 Tax=Pseudonocardia sulfidoxydans TaxID=54011 RepID=UPI003609358C
MRTGRDVTLRHLCAPIVGYLPFRPPRPTTVTSPGDDLVTDCSTRARSPGESVSPSRTPQESEHGA